MPHRHFHSGFCSQVPGQPLGKEHGTMLSTGAAERHHQTLETAALIGADTGIHQSKDICPKVMHCRLVVQVLDHWRILPRQLLVTFFPARIRKGTAIEDKSAAMPRLI